LQFFDIVVIAVGLAMDAFAVALGSAASGQARGPRAAFRLSFHFGLFQFLMPVVGWLVGTEIAQLFSAWDHWIAFALLAFVGSRMIYAGLHPDLPDSLHDPSRGLRLMMLSVATSIDALAVGLSLAMLQVSIWYPSAIIGVVTLVISIIGFQFGTRLGTRFGKRMEIVGGVVLILIGLRIIAPDWPL
jgi:manganese efflux pump family protein